MEPDGTMQLLCDDMDVCGDVIQALSDYLALEDLSSACDFPEEISALETMLTSAEELQSVRQRLSAEMADHSGMIRTLVVRAEDSRLMSDM
jgi:Bardet-Biedl syndrome 2 protein